MLDINDYIDDGKICRTNIAMDIRNGKLCEEDVDLLVNDERIQSSFIIKRSFLYKQKTDWSEEYLDSLTYASVSEAFDAEYLHHLLEVSEYCKKKKDQKSSRKRIFVISLVIITTAIISFVLNRRK